MYRIGDIVPAGNAWIDYECNDCGSDIYIGKPVYQVVGSQEFVCKYCVERNDDEDS